MAGLEPAIPSHSILNIIVNIWFSVKRKIQPDAGEIKSKEDIIDRFRSACNETTQLEIEKIIRVFTFPL